MNKQAMNNWKGNLRNYPVTMRIYHLDKNCSFSDAQEFVRFGITVLVEELATQTLLGGDYEYTFSAKAQDTLSNFCETLHNTGFNDDETPPVVFKYEEIRDAFQALLLSINANAPHSAGIIQDVVDLLERHYYCPYTYNQQILLSQYLHHANLSKNRQKKFKEEKKILLNGSSDISDKTLVDIDKDEVKIDGQLIPWRSKNIVLVYKSWGW